MCFEYTVPHVTKQFRYWFGNQRWGMPKGLGLYGLALCTYIYTYSTYTNVFRLYISSPPATGPTTFNTRHPCLIQQFPKSRTQPSSSSLCCDVDMHRDWLTKALNIDEDFSMNNLQNKCYGSSRQDIIGTSKCSTWLLTVRVRSC